MRPAHAKDKLLNAAIGVIRAKGYGATTVDDLCAAAGVTKGAFFHHFASKEALAVAAANHWSKVTTQFFASAPYRQHRDPLDRLLGYVQFRREIIRGKAPEFTCLVGTMVQETFQSNPAIRDACRESILGHSAEVAADVEAAKKLYAPNAKWSSESLALYFQAVIQGAFILAKAKEDPGAAAECLVHLERYVRFLFSKPSN